MSFPDLPDPPPTTGTTDPTTGTIDLTTSTTTGSADTTGTAAPACGDGVQDPGEQCDDGITYPTNANDWQPWLINGWWTSALTRGCGEANLHLYCLEI